MDDICVAYLPVRYARQAQNGCQHSGFNGLFFAPACGSSLKRVGHSDIFQQSCKGIGVLLRVVQPRAYLSA